MKDKWSNVTYEVDCLCSGDSPMYVVKDKQGCEKKYHWNHLLFIASLGTDSNAKPLAAQLAAGCRDDSTNIPDSTPKDVASTGNKEDSETVQMPEVRNIMAAAHSHDSEGPMGWIGKGFNSLSKAVTRVLSKDDGPIK